jgi:MoxR-like ATPase
MVLATQNPIEYEGTYTLPESQLDRFILRVEMGYPPGEDEIRIMRRRDPQQALQELQPVLTGDQLLELQRHVGDVRVDDSVAQYVLDIVQATREHEQIRLGASPRGSLAFYEACQARALVEGRDYVTPHDVKQLAVPVLGHRILVKSRGADLSLAARERQRVVLDILRAVKVPV